MGSALGVSSLANRPASARLARKMTYEISVFTAAAVAPYDRNPDEVQDNVASRGNDSAQKDLLLHAPGDVSVAQIRSQEIERYGPGQQ